MQQGAALEGLVISEYRASSHGGGGGLMKVAVGDPLQGFPSEIFFSYRLSSSQN